MRTAIDWICGIAFVFALLVIDGIMDENKARIEAARLSGVTEGAKAVAMKCGTVGGYINVKEQK